MSCSRERRTRAAAAGMAPAWAHSDVPRARRSRAAAADIAPAWAADVISSNVVGYNKVTLQPGLNMLSSQFVQVGSGNNSLTLLDAVKLTGQPSYDENDHAQTTLRFWTGSGYDYYDWSGNLTEENPDLAEALEEELEVDPETLNNHWLNGDYEVADEDIPSGEGFWLYAKNGGTLTLAGQVPADGASATFHVVAGLNMVSCPWPMAISLTKISMGNQPSFDENDHAQTTLRVWTGSGYDYYDWSGNLTEENPDLAEALEEELEVDPETLNNHWLNGDYEVADDAIAIGKAFWVYAKNAGTITFSK